MKPFGAKVVSELNVVGWKSRWIISRSIDQENWEEKLGFDTASLYPITNPDGSRGPGGCRVSALRDTWHGDRGPSSRRWATGASRPSTRSPGRKGTTTSSSASDTIRNRDVGYLYLPRGSGRRAFDGYATGQVDPQCRRRDHGRHAGRSVRGLPARRALELRRQPSGWQRLRLPRGRGTLQSIPLLRLRPGRVEGVAQPQPEPRAALGAGAAAVLQGKPDGNVRERLLLLRHRLQRRPVEPGPVRSPRSSTSSSGRAEI